MKTEEQAEPREPSKQATPDRQHLHHQLNVVFAGCKEPNWDSHGSKPITESALKAAHAFIDAIPAGVSTPDVVPESGGEICFDWSQGGEDLKVSKSGLFLCFSYFGDATAIHGTSQFQGTLSPVIAALIVSRFSEGES